MPARYFKTLLASEEKLAGVPWEAVGEEAKGGVGVSSLMAATTRPKGGGWNARARDGLKRNGFDARRTARERGREAPCDCAASGCLCGIATLLGTCSPCRDGVHLFIEEAAHGDL